MNVTSRSDVELMMVLPRGDASGVPVGKVSVPKTVQKAPSPREDATGASVGKVAVPKAGQYSSFATLGCH